MNKFPSDINIECVLSGVSFKDAGHWSAVVIHHRTLIDDPREGRDKMKRVLAEHIFVPKNDNFYARQQYSARLRHVLTVLGGDWYDFEPTNDLKQFGIDYVAYMKPYVGQSYYLKTRPVDGIDKRNGNTVEFINTGYIPYMSKEVNLKYLPGELESRK